MAVNNCIFIGRLTDDPSIRYMPDGEPVANFSIAINEKYKDKNGEQKEQTEYIRIVAFRKLAEIIAEYLKKGSQVFISGKMKTRKWQDQNGQDRYTTEIIADQMQMLGSKDDGNRGQNDYGSNRPPARQQDDFDDPDSIPF